MIKKADWEAAYRDLAAERRRRQGASTAARGPQDEDDDDAMEEFLALHPEVARALAEPPPERYEGRPGDRDFLTAAELEDDWATLQQRIATSEKAPVPLRRRQELAPVRPLRAWQLGSLAAALAAVVFAGLYWRALADAQRLAGELRQPRVHLEERLLLPDGQRGGSAQPPIPLPSEAEYYLLVPALVNHPRFPDYELEILDLEGRTPRRLWSASGLRRKSDDTFEILVPKAFLAPGKYRLVLYGLDDGSKQKLASYTVRVAPG